MLFLLPIYTKISNSNFKVTPSELRDMINEQTKNTRLSSEELVLLEVVYSFYKLGYESNTISNKKPVVSL